MAAIAKAPTSVVLAKVPSIYQQLMTLFPPEVQFAFAYGSGVFEQAGQNASTKNTNMIDLVLTVDDPLHFHSLNLKNNSSHYSFLKYGGPRLLTKVQQDFGAKVYYNTLVPFQQRLFKYGVVKKTTLISDLLDWDSLYLSGRLHKPVLVIKKSSDEALTSALKMNLNNAVHTALLLLPECFTEEEFYLKITELSYVGDFRMWVGEDKHKVKNIVSGSYQQFRKLYADVFNSLQHVHWNQVAGTIAQDWSPAARLHHLNLLPKQLQINLYKSMNKDGRQRDLEDVLKVISHDVDCESLVQEGIESIVWRSSWSQSLKGILTAGTNPALALDCSLKNDLIYNETFYNLGAIKSIRYSTAKMKKMFRSSRTQT